MPPTLVMATVGAVRSRVWTTAALVPTLPAASTSVATSEWLPSPESVTEIDQLPAASTTPVPSATPPSRTVTVVPTSPVPVTTRVVALETTPALVMATVGAVVSSASSSAAVKVPSEKRKVSTLATLSVPSGLEPRWSTRVMTPPAFVTV